MYIDSYDISDPKTNIDEVRQNIGMVFQHFNLFPHLNVLRNITLAPTQLKKVDETKAEKQAMHYLDIVGLTKRHKQCLVNYLGVNNNEWRLPAH